MVDEVKENDVTENSIEKVEVKENDVVKNSEIDVQNLSENELRAFHKNFFLNMSNEILHQAADILTQWRKVEKINYWNFRRKN